MELAHALAELPGLRARAARGRLAVVLDFDGTLSEIVEVPSEARLEEPMRQVLAQLAAELPVAILSGRGLDDVSSRIGLSQLVIAGCHGFEIRGRGGLSYTHPEGFAAEPALKQAAAALAESLGAIPGCIVEDKRFALSVHYRQVARSRVSELIEAVERVLAEHAALRLQQGKMVLELLPAVDWHKGRALKWLLNALGHPPEHAVYLGDDETDEDAFRALAGRGLGIRVGEIPKHTAATAWLRDPDAVRQLLGGLLGAKAPPDSG